MKKTSLVAILTICLILAFSFGIVAQEAPTFKDTEGHWSLDAVETVYSYGIIKGYEDNTFRPSNKVTRAEFAVMLDRLLALDKGSLKAAEAAKLPFVDVPANHYAYEAIANLYDAGIIKGITATTFDPKAYIMRQDAAVLIARADEVDEDLNLALDTKKNIAQFNDVGAISKYAVDGMTFAYQAGILNGYNGNIAPKAFLTRGETAQVFANTVDKMLNPPLPVAISQDDWAANKQFVDTETGLHMAYVEMGDRNGEPLVLIHGASDSSRSWSLIAPYFAQAGYHLYIPEMRGHGDTGTGGAARIEEGLMAYDVIGFLDAMGLDRVNLMGHSRGGKIVQLVALNYPERVSRLVMESPAGVGGNTEGGRDQFYYEAPFDKLPINGPYFDGEFQWDNYMDWWYYNDNPVDEKFLSMAKYEASWLPLEAWRAIGGSLAEPQEFNDDIPFMGVFGSEDYLIPGAANQEKNENLYGKALDVSLLYDGFGHNIHWEDPAKLSKDVLDFFDKYPAAEVVVDNSYEIGEYEAPPVAATGMDPAPYYNDKGRLIKQLSSIPQGDWVNFKHYVKLASGINMAYIEMGNPEGEDLVLLHGMTDSSRSWTSIVSYFADDYHLYIPDQRGHGNTDKPDMKKYDRSLFSYDISCFFDAMGLEKANVMGHSMGSMNAQAFAMDYPEKVDKLILESTAMIGTNSGNNAESYSSYDSENPANAGKAWKEEYIAETDTTIDSNTILTWGYIQWWYYNTIPVPEVFHQMVMTDCYNYPQENWTFLFPAQYQARILANHGIDTLVLYGTSDYLMGGDTQEVVKEQMNQAYTESLDSTAQYQYKAYEGYGHNIHWEIPETIYNDVNNFLQGTQPK